MGKASKLYEKWVANPPREVRLQEIKTVLNHYFPDMWDQTRGSHIVVRCEALKSSRDFQPHGEFDIPVKGGQKVKGHYVKTLIKAIDFIDELESLK